MLQQAERVVVHHLAQHVAVHAIAFLVVRPLADDVVDLNRRIVDQLPSRKADGAAEQRLVGDLRAAAQQPLVEAQRADRRLAVGHVDALERPHLRAAGPCRNGNCRSCGRTRSMMPTFSVSRRAAAGCPARSARRGRQCRQHREIAAKAASSRSIQSGRGTASSSVMATKSPRALSSARLSAATTPGRSTIRTRRGRAVVRPYSSSNASVGVSVVSRHDENFQRA